MGVFEATASSAGGGRAALAGAGLAAGAGSVALAVAAAEPERREMRATISWSLRAHRSSSLAALSCSNWMRHRQGEGGTEEVEEVRSPFIYKPSLITVNPWWS